MTVTIGINPITWTNDDMPELGGDTPLEVCLTEAKHAGYSGIELGGKFPRRSSELMPIMQRYGLKIVSGWFDGRILEHEVEQEFDAATPHLQLLRDFNCKYVVYADVTRGVHNKIAAPISSRPKLSKTEFQNYGKKITQLAEKMADFGVRMAFHHHMGTIVESDDDVSSLMMNTGEAVGLLLDTGHSIFAGGNPLKLAEKHAKRIVHVHCKDSRRVVLEHSREKDAAFMRAVLDGIFTVPGDGFIDYPAILKVLAGASYRGWLVVEAEQDPKKAHPLTYATLGFKNLSRLARDAGFTVA